ncbi:DUF1552 domain-containing protein [Blastopirellula marina]|uniref:DUF1552 domain-containing protein n=1 Tax=Blastopirellula marina TaxID=124 RepID=A0A2S8GN77_9BACT|nr:DUF1552 domain-containing protein [Blastopirellula marina]PQO45880.1 hypothetical protein C5Y93_11530 [Blastopirellula marina]
MSKSISRRTALRGLGVSLSLPLLDAMLPRAKAAPSQFTPVEKTLARQPRMICCYVPNGVNILEWMPENDGAGYKLSPTLEALSSHRDDFTVYTGMGHPNSKGGHSGADTWLTGADLAATPGSDYTNWVSADQIAAEHHSKQTRFGSLQLSDSSGTGSAGHSHTLSFNRRGTPVPAENSPKRLFERLFVPESAGDRAATLQRYAEQKSILDSVLDEARALHKKLGKKDQQKLDQYLGSVRETELRVERMEEWIDVPKPEIDAKFLQLGSKSHDAHDRPMWIDVMMELSYLAFVTDTTRVITYEWSREAGGLGGGGENHHELSHHGGDAGMLKKLGVIDRFHLSRLNRFLDFLKETEDGEGNMLDHTMVLYGSGMNSGKGGEHSPKNLPLLLAGGQGLGLRHGRHVAYDENDHPPLSNLLLTMIQKMGVETDSFSDSTGTLTT